MSLNTAFTKSLEASVAQLKADGVYKRLNYLTSPQSARVQMEGRGEVLILSSNNYLGLCDEPSVVLQRVDESSDRSFGYNAASRPEKAPMASTVRSRSA